MKKNRVFTWLAVAYLSTIAPPLLHAQVVNHCWIKYTYDGSGNRIKREWWCGDPNGHTEGGEPKSVQTASFGMTLQPNPATDEITLVASDDLAGANVTMLSSVGEVVYDRQANGTNLVLTVRELAAGMYTLRVYRKQEEFTTRFQVMH